MMMALVAVAVTVALETNVVRQAVYDAHVRRVPVGVQASLMPREDDSARTLTSLLSAQVGEAEKGGNQPP